MKVKCIRKKFLKSRKFFASWVSWPLKMATMAIWLFLRPKKICQPPGGGGICALKNFIIGTWLLCNLNDTFATLYILTTPTAPHTKLFRKTKVYFYANASKSDN